LILFPRNYLKLKPNNIIKAGFLQFNPILGDSDKNIRTIRKLIGSDIDANLLVLPELSNSGYNFESREQAVSVAENTENSRFIDFLVSMAKDNNMFIVSGFNEVDQGKLYNTSILVGANGLLGKYRKVHLFMNEWDIFERGDLGFPVFDLGFCKIGMLICFDWMFPEAWRILALKGADVICHPSNLVLPYAQQAVPVHGMINRTFNITANRTGSERGIKFTGQSIISDPEGRVMRKASPDKEGVVITDIDLSLARNKMITARNHAFNDRIPSEYSYLMQ